MLELMIPSFIFFSPSDSGPSLLTPTSRRKNLILQHQQRSSMDTEALDLEQETDQVSGAYLDSKNVALLHNKYDDTVFF